jgi:hypothetical protein
MRINTTTHAHMSTDCMYCGYWETEEITLRHTTPPITQHVCWGCSTPLPTPTTTVAIATRYGITEWVVPNPAF